jgi:hypothetical protein
MSCEQYKTVMVEAAGVGRTDAVLQSHLDSCAPCRAVFSSEENLFSAIDAGVSRGVNHSPSAEFLARVRTAVELENSGGTLRPKYWFTLWPVTATAIAVCVTSLVVGHFRSRSVVQQPSAATVVVSRESVAPRLPQPAAEPATEPVITRNLSTRKSAVDHEQQSDNAPEPAMPEVLVPSDERDALAYFVAGLPARREVAIALARPAPFQPPPDVGASGPLEIAKLEVKPLIPVEEK